MGSSIKGLPNIIGMPFVPYAVSCYRAINRVRVRVRVMHGMLTGVHFQVDLY